MKLPGRRVLTAGACALLVAAAFFMAATLVTTQPFQRSSLLLPCLPEVNAPSGSGYAAPGVAALADAAVGYAVARTVPQQTRAEIALSLAVLHRRAPLRLLVLGLGRDSALWHALNPGGATVFLEEDPVWYRDARKRWPHLRVHLVAYRTRLDAADRLLAGYRTQPACLPDLAGDDLDDVRVRGNAACPLALHDLPPEVYENEWDMIMLDAPKGYFAAAPGRMAAIWTAAAMARATRRGGHGRVPARRQQEGGEGVRRRVPLREVPRGTGWLWHFSIPPASRRRSNGTAAAGGRRPFC